MYWSNRDLLSNRVAFVALTERLAPKYESEVEAHAISATAFALLTYLARAQTAMAKPIVHWIQSRRNFVQGWWSSYDSFRALKSVVEYAIRHGDSIQQYNVRVNVSSSDNVFKTRDTLVITDENIIDLQTTEIDSVFGRALVDAYGIGYTLVQVRMLGRSTIEDSLVSFQLQVEVNVEHPELIRPMPHVPFHISLDIRMSNRYNFSYLLYEPCVT